MADNHPLSRANLIATLGKYVGDQEAQRELDRVFGEMGLNGEERLTTEDFEKVLESVEGALGREVGAAMARAVVTDKLQIKPEDMGRFYESFNRMRLQLLERQRRAEALTGELTRLKELYENVSMSIPIGLASVDLAMKVTTWNKAMERITGHPAEKAVGARTLEVIPEFEPLMIKSLQLREALRESRFVRGAGDEKKIATVTVSPLVDQYEILRGLVIAVQDITEHVEMEESVRRAEKLASVGKLAAGVAHEVGNPLTSISALVQELAEDAAGDEEFMKESLDIIGHHINRISGILKDLVDYSRKKEPRFREASPVDIIRRAIPLVKFDKRGHKIEIEVEAPAGLPLVVCDEDQIEQALLNLLFNAADAMNGEGIIRVTAWSSSETTVAFSVSDSGTGMDSQTAKNALTPFYTTKAVGEGAGLGLYVCYNILENHNSRLDIESAPGAGTTVRFELKAA